MIPIDILPVFKSPAVQVLTFYGGMPAASIEKDITNRMERWVGQANGTSRQESRSIVGASIVRNYFRSDVDPNGALTQVNSLALAAVPNLPPGTLAAGRAAVRPDQHHARLHRRGRQPRRLAERVDPLRRGAVRGPQHAHEHQRRRRPGGLRRQDPRGDGLPRPPEAPGPRALAARRDERAGQLQPLPADRRRQVRRHRLRARLELDVRLPPRTMGSIPLRTELGNVSFLRDVATPKDAAFIQTNVVRVNGRREVYIPVFRQLGSSTLAVVDSVRKQLPEFTDRLTRGGIDLKLVMDQSVYVRQSISSLVQEGVPGGHPLLADDPAVPGPVADDGDRRDDAADLGPLGVHLPLLHGQHDQRDDAGRPDPGDRADGRQRDHLPGEHAPAPGHGGRAARRRRSSGPARWRCPSWSRRSARSWCSRRWP